MCCSCQMSPSASSQSGAPSPSSPWQISGQRKSASTKGNHPESFSSSIPHRGHNRSPTSAVPSAHPARTSSATGADGAQDESSASGALAALGISPSPVPFLAAFPFEAAPFALPDLGAADAFCRRGALPELTDPAGEETSALIRFISCLLPACIPTPSRPQRRSIIPVAGIYKPSWSNQFRLPCGNSLTTERGELPTYVERRRRGKLTPQSPSPLAVAVACVIKYGQPII